MVSWNATTKSFVCNYAMPGVGCDLPEMSFLAVLFWCCDIVSIFFLIYNIRKSRAKIRIFDQTVLFWLFLAIWQFYRGLIALVPFKWDAKSFKVGYTALNHILLFVPMCLVVLILFDLLFTYRNPGTNAIVFFRSLFIIFLVTFLTIGITIAVVDLDDATDPGTHLSLWCACTDLILAIFFALPAKSLLDSVTYPMVQEEDVCCVRTCTVGIIVYVLVFFARMLWNGTQYFSGNKLQDWLEDQYNHPAKDGKPNGKARTFTFFFFFLFDFIPAIFAQVSVYLFKKHDMMFNENPYFTRTSD